MANSLQVLTFYLSIGVQTHRANADAIFGKLEAMVAQDGHDEDVETVKT